MNTFICIYESHNPMDIRCLSLIEGARLARGLTVIIDVFRAFTTDAFVMANGAKTIIPVGTIDEALKLHSSHPDWILMGEREGKKIDGFHYGNSPGIIKDTDFSGMTIIQTTGAGTKGIINAIEADEIILGRFVMAEAIVQYILDVNPGVVSLVAMGWNGKIKSIEDEFFADYINQRLRGKSPVFKNIKKAIKLSPEAVKFFNPIQKDFIEDDFHCAMDLNRFNFTLKVIQNDLRSVIRLDR